MEAQIMADTFKLMKLKNQMANLLDGANEKNYIEISFELHNLIEEARQILKEKSPAEILLMLTK
jgi:hypothetical protein